MILSGAMVTPVRDIVLGPKRGEVGQVIRVSVSWDLGRIVVEFERNGVMRQYSLSGSMVRKVSPLELLAEAANEETD